MPSANSVVLRTNDVASPTMLRLRRKYTHSREILHIVQMYGIIFLASEVIAMKEDKLSDLSVSIVVDTWMKSFGTGTIFAMEYFPAFAMMMSNTFVGGYIDQQLTIEKIAGQDMVPFVKTLLQIGAMAV